MSLFLDQNGLNTCNSLPDLRNLVPRATDKIITSESDLINSCLNEEVVKNEDLSIEHEGSESDTIPRTKKKDKKEIVLIKRFLQSFLCHLLNLSSAEIEDSNLESTVLYTTRLNEWWVSALNTILSRIDLLSERLRLIMEEAERRATISNIVIFARHSLSGTTDFAKDLWDYLRLLPVYFRTKLLSVPKPLTL